MDGFKGKRTAAAPVMPRRASGLVLHENMKKKDDKIVPTCSRVGCSSRVSTNKGLSVDHKPKSTTLRSPSNGKETVGSSSRTTSGLTKASKVTIRRQRSSLLDTDSSESSSSVHDEAAATERRGKTKQSTVREVVTEPGSSSRKPDLVTRMGSSRNGVNRNGLRDLRSKPESDVLPSSSNPTRKLSTFRKKTSDGESSSSSRGNKPDRSVIEVKNQNSPLPPHGNGITMSESRRNRNSPSVRDNSVVSSSTRRSYGRTGRSSGGVTTLQAPQPATRAALNPSRSNNTEVSRSPLHSYSRPISSNGRLRSLMMPGGSPSRSLMNRDGFRRYDVNGVAEVLLALERMGQDEELTYEQLAVLETNLFLNGFHDQHRDMRLDIDNMSYEELLALEEKMGTVSTALSEEALLKSLKLSTFNHPTDESSGTCVNKDDDVKCSICQEEYVDGEDVGTLPCQHMYHASCAQQWLRMKNWCPICKTSAAESQPQPFS
ncbi:hypothetical protein Bca4012_014786 [Brassica carinata]|uniref:RING-type E3 ubiquitin transferase n=1 Tax=Brassica carinata TaxID=52824 RepID=A0A8X7P0Z1_BRACI|nr:hypothetical protein Bca52824_095644 [Brassica carinata]